MYLWGYGKSWCLEMSEGKYLISPACYTRVIWFRCRVHRVIGCHWWNVSYNTVLVSYIPCFVRKSFRTIWDLGFELPRTKVKHYFRVWLDGFIWIFFVLLTLQPTSFLVFWSVNVFLGDSLDRNAIYWTGNSARPSSCSLLERVQSEKVAIPDQRDLGNPVCFSGTSILSDIM